MWWAARVASVASLVAHDAVPDSAAAPRLTIVYPLPGVSIPSENPAVVLRYSSGDVSDPLDLRSLVILVDGRDRTGHFRVTADAAWGRIVDGATGINAHEVEARVCTVRGVCARLSAIVTVVAPVVAKPAAVDKERRGKVIDVFLEAARRLLRP
jgi:hypothetical protein